MSHGERQAWAGAAPGVAVQAPVGSTGAVAEICPPQVPPAGGGPTSQWELLYRTVARAQVPDVLALASQRGLLYKQYVQQTTLPRSLPATEEPRNVNLLGKMLAGQVGQLESVQPLAIDVFDQDLDETQRHAVA